MRVDAGFASGRQLRRFPNDEGFEERVSRQWSQYTRRRGVPIGQTPEFRPRTTGAAAAKSAGCSYTGCLELGLGLLRGTSGSRGT